MKKAILTVISVIGLSLLVISNSCAESEEMFSIQDGKLILTTVKTVETKKEVLDIFNGNVKSDKIPLSVVKSLVRGEILLYQDDSSRKIVNINHWSFPLEITEKVLVYTFDGDNILSESVSVPAPVVDKLLGELFWRVLIALALLISAILLRKKSDANMKFAHLGGSVILGILASLLMGAVINGPLIVVSAVVLAVVFAATFAVVFVVEFAAVLFTAVLFTGVSAVEVGYSAAGINEYLLFISAVLVIGFLIINSKPLIDFFKNKYFLKNA